MMLELTQRDLFVNGQSMIKLICYLKVMKCCSFFRDFGRFFEVFDTESGRISMNYFNFGTIFTDFGTLSLIYEEIAMNLDQFHKFWTISMRFWNMIVDLRWKLDDFGTFSNNFGTLTMNFNQFDEIWRQF